MTQIEIDIRNIINEVICGKYIGKLKVIQETMPNNNTLWMLLLYLDRELTPMILAYEGTEEQFKEYIRKEIKTRKLHGVHFWNAIQEYRHYDDENNDSYE